MNTIITSSDTPPPLQLILDTLSKMRNDQGQPMNFQYGRTNVVNLSQEAGALHSSSAAADVGWLTLAGQLLWRYLPVLIPDAAEAITVAGAVGASSAALLLDAQGKNAHYQRHNLSTRLFNGEKADLLYNAIRPALRTGALRRSTGLATLQASTAGVIPRHRLSMATPDYRILPDYTVLRTRRQLYGLGSLAMFKQKIAADYRLRDAKASARHRANLALMGQGAPKPRPMTQPLLAALNGATRPRVVSRVPLRLLSHVATARASDRGAVHCDISSHNPFQMDGSLRTGEFFSSPVYTAELEPLEAGLFGYVDIDKTPMRMVLNSTMAYPRLQISFAHEMLHILMEMHKLDVPHSVIHELATLIVNEIVPGLDAMAKYTNHEYNSN